MQIWTIYIYTYQYTRINIYFVVELLRCSLKTELFRWRLVGDRQSCKKFDTFIDLSIINDRSLLMFGVANSRGTSMILLKLVVVFTIAIEIGDGDTVRVRCFNFRVDVWPGLLFCFPYFDWWLQWFIYYKQTIIINNDFCVLFQQLTYC